MASEKLSQAIQLIKSGNRTAALPILKEVVKTEPNNENAWLWLYSCVENVEQKKYCLQQALKINPNNQDTHNALLKLENRTLTKSQSINREIDYSPRPTLDHRANDEKRPIKKSMTRVSMLLVGLLTIGVFCLAATLIFLFAQRNTNIFGNLPFLTSAKFESVTGSTKFIPPNLNDPMIEDSTIQITVNYLTEMAQGDTVNITITCVNNSDKPIDKFGVSFDGIPTAPFRNNVNYFNGISVISTDPQLTEAFPDSSGNLHFHFGRLNPKESKTVSLDVTANFGGVYLGGVYVSIEQGDSYGGYDATFTTTVK